MNKIKKNAELNNSFIPMPKQFIFFNSNKEPCDMAFGPCCCGAWHKLSEWPDEVLQQFN